MECSERRESRRHGSFEIASKSAEREEESAGSGPPGEASEDARGSSRMSENAVVIDQVRRGLPAYPSPGEMQIRGRYSKCWKCSEAAEDLRFEE